MEMENESKKIPIPWKREEMYMSSPWNWERVLNRKSLSVDIVQIFEAISIYSLVHDDRDGIVEDTFAEDDAVQLRIDFVCVEDGQNGYRIGSGQS
jgi:hypothetical protein